MLHLYAVVSSEGCKNICTTEVNVNLDLQYVYDHDLLRPVAVDVQVDFSVWSLLSTDRVELSVERERPLFSGTVPASRVLPGALARGDDGHGLSSVPSPQSKSFTLRTC